MFSRLCQAIILFKTKTNQHLSKHINKYTLKVSPLSSRFFQKKKKKHHSPQTPVTNQRRNYYI